jgi:transposase
MKIGTQVIKGVEYVYEDHPYWDSKKQRGSHKRIYIGKNINGVFVPNKRHKLQTELEQLKTEVKPGPIPTEACKRDFYGATYLLDSIGNRLGIADDLKSSFPEDYKQILSLAYYLVLEDHNPMYRFSRWSKSHHHPFGKDIPSQRISELFGRIGESAKMAFFNRQSKRRLEKEYLAYDTTSISSYSQSLKQVKYGNNKEHDPLPQINLALLFGESSGLPVYYRKLPGNIVDVKTIPQLLKDLDFMTIEKVKLVMDRGFYSEKNINELYRQHHKFLIAGKTSLKFVGEKLEKIRQDFDTRKHYNSKTNLYIQSFSMDWSYSETKPRSGEVAKGTRRIYVHYYYNEQHAADDKTRLNKLLDTLETELLEERHSPEHEKLYTKYFNTSTTPIRGVKIEPKQEAIDKTVKNCGYFVLMSNDIKDPVEALEIYRAKDLVEKAFGNMKERLNMRRESVSSEENLEGKLFVQFIALIYMSYLKRAMDVAGLFKNYTMQELIDDLDIIERFHHPGKSSQIGEITEKQKKLYAAMAVTSPA